MTAPDEKDPVREAKIREILQEELQDGEDLANESRRMIGYLLREKKGYAPEDVRQGLALEVQLGPETAWSSGDFLVIQAAVILSGKYQGAHRLALAN